MVKRLMIIFIVLVLVSGCIETKGDQGQGYVNNETNKEIKELAIPGHTQYLYKFSYDIRESMLVPSNDPSGIKEGVWNSDTLNIVFDGSSGEDNAYFQVVLINIISKLRPFFAFEFKQISYDTFYYDGEQWYNGTGDEISRPVFDNAVMWLLGPNTGANETSVNLEADIIYIEGTSYEDLVKAGDRFALIVMGVERVEE